MKYILDFSINRPMTAGPKAREDISRILSCEGYRTIKFVISKNAVLMTIISLLRLPFVIQEKSDVIVQYPMGRINIINRWIVSVLKFLRCSICILVHDLESLRMSGKLSQSEVKILLKANRIIVHTEAMKDLLLHKGFAPESVKVLKIFDYLADTLNQNSIKDDAVVFAGNLGKSEFLPHLKNVPCRFKLYGGQMDLSDILSENVSYCGSFQPNDLSALNGKWGLVWDGSSRDTCNGCLGSYLRFNSPHKLSLYIAAGIPVIVWTESATKEFVVKNNLGIAVDSLRHIDKILNGVSVSDYEQMKSNVEKTSIEIRQGKYILKAIRQSKA